MYPDFTFSLGYYYERKQIIFDKIIKMISFLFWSCSVNSKENENMYGREKQK